MQRAHIFRHADHGSMSSTFLLSFILPNHISEDSNNASFLDVCLICRYFLGPPHQFSSVAQSCPTLCDPMDLSTPGFSIHHQLPELRVTLVVDAIVFQQPPGILRWKIRWCVQPLSERKNAQGDFVPWSF